MNQIKNPIKLLEKIWKIGLVVFVVSSLIFGTLVLRFSDAFAQAAPNMTVQMLVSEVEVPAEGWTKTLNTTGGKTVKFYIEIHNTVVGTQANNVTARVSLPSGVATSHSIPISVTTSNSNSASDTVTVNVTSPASGGQIVYHSGSTRLIWDQNGDGILDFNHSTLADGIAAGGISIGNQSGCNEFIIRLNFLANVVAGPASTPTPTPAPASSPSPSPSPSPAAANINIQNTQNQTQTVTLAAAVPAPAKQPLTGPSVLGMVTMAGGLPLGLALARYGRGQVLIRRKDERLGEFADGMTKDRLLRKDQA